jgi:hypothetical protein
MKRLKQVLAFSNVNARVRYALLCAALFWLQGVRPLVGEPWQWADDGLFLRQAEGFSAWAFGNGKHWLGAYDFTTISKPPALAIWLSVIHILGIPLRVAEFGALCLLPILFSRAITPMVRLGTGGFTCCAFLIICVPTIFVEYRLLRDGLQSILASGTLISVIGLLLRFNAGVASQCTWAVCAGLFWSGAYLNREESLWLLPALIWAISIITIYNSRKRRIAYCLAPLLTLGGSVLFPISLVAYLNYDSYGVFLTSSRRGPEISKLWSVLGRLEPESKERLVPIRQSTRMKAYEISPAFARFRPFFDGPPGDEFAANPGQLAMNGRSLDQREFFVSSFEWGMLKGGDFAGAKTAKSLEFLFGEAATELLKGIDDGRISAGQSSFFLSVGSPIKGDFSRIFLESCRSLRQLINIYGLESIIDPPKFSSGSSVDLNRIAHLTSTPTAPTKEEAGKVITDHSSKYRVQATHLVFQFLRVAYLVLIISPFLAIPLLLIKTKFGESARMGLYGWIMVTGSLVSFCIIMGIMEVLSWSNLHHPNGYNRLGYTPLSILSGFSLAIILSLNQWYLSWSRSERK